LFFLIPITLNYPNNFSEIKNKNDLGYLEQFILIIASTMLIYMAITVWNIFTIHKWKRIINISKKLKSKQSKKLNQKVESIKNQCFNIPYFIFFIQIIVFTTISICVNIFFGVHTGFSTRSRLVLIIISTSSLVSILSLPIINNIFKGILLFIYGEQIKRSKLSIKQVINIPLEIIQKLFCSLKKRKPVSIRNGLSKIALQNVKVTLNFKSFIQILPMLITVMFFVSFLGYSRLIQEKGTLVYKDYKIRLVEKYEQINNSKNIDDIKKIINEIIIHEDLKDMNSTYLIARLDTKEVYVSDNSNLSNVFKFNIFNEKSRHIQDESGAVQAAVIPVQINGQDLIVGIKYKVSSFDTIYYFIIISLLLVLINIIVIYLFSKSITENINDVTYGLKKIVAQNSILGQDLPVISNDEIGDLLIRTIVFKIGKETMLNLLLRGQKPIC
jgi:hypothetical protein